MWKIFILTIFQLVCVVQMIINGYNVNSIKERPFQVAINSGYIPYFSADYNCSGSIISKDFVLTAAHCLRHNLTYVVRVGTIYGVWFGNVHDIEKISVHPNYTFSPYIRNDVALLKVRPEIEFESSVQPIELADIYFPKYVDLITTVSGYGANCLVCNAVGRLQAVDLSTITNKECGETFDNLYENQICATGSFLKTGTSNNFVFSCNLC